MVEDDRPLVVAYDIRDVLARIQQGVDSANAALALKADKADLEAAKQQLHGRIDDVRNDMSELRDQVHEVKEDAARSKGWRDGALVAVGLCVGVLGALVFYIVTN